MPPLFFSQTAIKNLQEDLDQEKEKMSDGLYLKLSKHLIDAYNQEETFDDMREQLRQSIDDCLSQKKFNNFSSLCDWLTSNYELLNFTGLPNEDQDYHFSPSREVLSRLWPHLYSNTEQST
jgi:trans-2-enoyl-CoA reductase